MPIFTYLIVASAAYLAGSIPFGYLLVRFIRKEDIRSVGSGNIGATNVLRSGSKALGALTLLLDALKGYVSVLLAGYLAHLPGLAPVAQQDAIAVAAVFAILGHVYPVWLKFKGGKGVATGLGLFLALAPYAALASVGVFAIVVLLTRYVSLASILGAAAFPAFSLALPHAPRTEGLTAVIVCLPLLVIAKHHQNIGRLLHGTEYRFGKSRSTAA
jgi:glycerol-3-phosphate acyltransferase PlsY